MVRKRKVEKKRPQITNYSLFVITCHTVKRAHSDTSNDMMEEQFLPLDGVIHAAQTI
jgi:hypothetical protein